MPRNPQTQASGAACQTCAFSRPKPLVVNETDQTPNTLECRVNAPTVSLGRVGRTFPFVADLDWCGRWAFAPLDLPIEPPNAA